MRHSHSTTSKVATRASGARSGNWRRLTTRTCSMRRTRPIEAGAMITKAEIQRRLLVAKYPRRGMADLRSAPDHNPLVLEHCPTCHGSGRRCEWEPGEATLWEC